MNPINQWPEEIDPIGFFVLVEMFAKASNIPFQTIPEQYSAIRKYEQKVGGIMPFTFGLS